MVLSVINKINNNLKFIYHKNKFLTPTLRRLLCNTLIQPNFYYDCCYWYPNLTKQLKKKIECKAGRCIKTSTLQDTFIVIPSLERWPTKPKEAPSPH